MKNIFFNQRKSLKTSKINWWLILCSISQYQNKYNCYSIDWCAFHRLIERKRAAINWTSDKLFKISIYFEHITFPIWGINASFWIKWLEIHFAILRTKKKYENLKLIQSLFLNKISNPNFFVYFEALKLLSTNYHRIANFLLLLLCR